MLSTPVTASTVATKFVILASIFSTFPSMLAGVKPTIVSVLSTSSVVVTVWVVVCGSLFWLSLVLFVVLSLSMLSLVFSSLLFVSTLSSVSVFVSLLFCSSAFGSSLFSSSFCSSLLSCSPLLAWACSISSPALSVDVPLVWDIAWVSSLLFIKK